MMKFIVRSNGHGVMLNLNDLQFFVVSVAEGGFAAAGRKLGVPKSTVSKRVAALEEALSTRLIHRTSRSFVLTEVGQDFHARAQAALIEAEAAETVVRERQAEPSGVVRITCSIPTAQSLFVEHLPALARALPKVQLELDVTDRFVDLLRDNVDIALRCHSTPLPDSGLIQRMLQVEQFVLVAAPRYVEACGPIAAPGCLQSHAGLLSGPDQGQWRLHHPSGAKCDVAPRRVMVANESTVLISAACAGLGIASLPEDMVRNAIDADLLRRVLPDWHAGTISTTLLTTHRRGTLPGVRAVQEFLVQACRASPQASRDLRAVG